MRALELAGMIRTGQASSRDLFQAHLAPIDPITG